MITFLKKLFNPTYGMTDEEADDYRYMRSVGCVYHKGIGWIRGGKLCISPLHQNKAEKRMKALFPEGFMK